MSEHFLVAELVPLGALNDAIEHQHVPVSPAKQCLELAAQHAHLPLEHQHILVLGLLVE